MLFSLLAAILQCDGFIVLALDLHLKYALLFHQILFLIDLLFSEAQQLVELVLDLVIGLSQHTDFLCFVSQLTFKR